MLIASLLRGHPGGTKQDERPVRQLPDVSRIVPELHAISVRLLQVVRDDETVFTGIRPGAAFEPIGEPRMQFRPLAFRQAGIRRVTDQEVSESERLVTEEVRTFGSDQLPAGESGKATREAGPFGVGEELRERPGPEGAADDRRAFKEMAFGPGQAIEPCRKESSDRRRDREAWRTFGRSSERSSAMPWSDM